MIAALFAWSALAAGPSTEDVRWALGTALAVARSTVALEHELKRIIGSGAAFRFSPVGDNVFNNEDFSRYFRGYLYFDGNGYRRCEDVRKAYGRVLKIGARVEKQMGKLESHLTGERWDSPRWREKTERLSFDLSASASKLREVFPAEWVSAPSWKLVDVAFTFHWYLPFTAQPAIPRHSQVVSSGFWLYKVVLPDQRWQVGQGKLPEGIWFSNQGTIDRENPSDAFVYNEVQLSIQAPLAVLCLSDPKVELSGVWRIEYRLPGSPELIRAETPIVLQGRAIE